MEDSDAPPMKLPRLHWLHRWSPFHERPTLLRNPSQKLFFVYLASFIACAFLLYVSSAPNASPNLADEVKPRSEVNAFRDVQPVRVSSHEPTRGNHFTPIKDISLDGGAKDPSILSEEGVKTILLWNSFFKQPDYIPPLSQMCPEYPCRVTSDRSVEADAVIVHLRDIDPADVPKRRSPDQIFTLLNAEAPPYSPPIPEVFNDLFNWTITYRLDADFPLMKRVETLYRYKKSDKLDYFANKTKMAAWFVSHCSTASERETLVSELSRYGVHTDIVGTCGPLKCPREQADDCFREFSKHYLFYLSFENAICTDYVTEKLFNALELGEMVPVVLGGADYSRVAPPGSYINVNKFASVKELAHYLQKVGNDPKLYNSYHKWRNFYQLTEPPHYACRLCARLHTIHRRRMYQDFNAYWHSNTCHGGWRKAYKLN
ncbi:alpha-(1,3)-fucosyltransferase C [Galendromus occidentalis]|uniref:Fucosyltransferase n=1 Tax=Galendromus occidentalis TaxID=34638 RepID=A0AAJ7L5T0_9ACAR|nr:alpha-(1,3)-fucosyltransferase C [Galendromus occidentalis]